MKKIINIALITLIALSSCEQEDFTGTGLESLSDFSVIALTNPNVELNSVDPDGEIVIQWNESKSGLNSDIMYSWIAYEAGESLADALLNLPSDNDGAANQLTVTNAELDVALADLGLEPGESISLEWTVLATNGDITKVASPSTVTITRFVDVIAPFNLLSPGDGSLLELNGDMPDGEILVTWEDTFAGLGGSVNYIWEADARGGDFSDPLLSFDSDEMGTLSQITFTQQQLDDVLSGAGLAEGEILEIDWRVVASTDELTSISSVFMLDIRRFDTKVDFQFILNLTEADIPDNLDVFVAGQWDRIGVAPSEWQQPGTNPDLQLSYNSDESRFELNLRVAENLIGTSFEYKYFLATTATPNWGNGEQQFTSGGCSGTSNRLVTFSAASQVIDDEVAVWEGYCPADAPMRILLSTTANFPDGAGQDVYVAGNFGFIEWPQPGTDDRLRMNDIGGGQYEIFLPVPNGHSGEFKFFLATKDAPNWGQGEQVPNGTMTGCDGAPNRSFTFTGSEEIIETVDVWEGFCPF